MLLKLLYPFRAFLFCCLRKMSRSDLSKPRIFHRQLQLE
jgi:hypothetical protein